MGCSTRLTSAPDLLSLKPKFKLKPKLKIRLNIRHLGAGGRAQKLGICVRAREVSVPCLTDASLKHFERIGSINVNRIKLIDYVNMLSYWRS